MHREVLDASTVICSRPPKDAAECPCATCPFIEGNDRALAKLVVDMQHPNAPYTRLQKALVPLLRIVARLFPKFVAGLTRKLARKIADELPFICHSSLYEFNGKGSTVKPQSEWRLCKGAEALKENSRLS